MKFRFVLIDDAAFLREILKNILSSLGGLCVGEAVNGEEALKIVGTTLPDIVFMDLVMPKQNGIEATRLLREMFPDLKIIGCSTVDDIGVIQKAMEAGLDDYIAKPFTREQITEAVSKILPLLGESTYGST